MKYIIIKGARSSGKSETINEICKRLKPATIRKVHISDTGNACVQDLAPMANITEGSYLINVRKKNILLVACAPTEQRKRITCILESLHKLNLKPDFAIVAMRGLEKLKDFATSKELENFGRCIHETKIWRIPSNRYNLTDEWNKRISYLTAITLHNI